MNQQSSTSPLLHSIEEELEKLYDQRLLIDNLIESLERYSETRSRSTSARAGLDEFSHPPYLRRMAS